MVQARIRALGSYLPEKRLTNEDLEKMVNTSDDWISTRTGIKERRVAGLEEANSDLAVQAAQRALSRAGMDANEVEMIIVATTTPDFLMPGTAPIVQSKLGAKNAAAFDLQAVCTGFIYGLSVAKAYVESGMYRNILLIGSEKMSSIIDYTDRATCVLFGDGAAAAVITADGPGLAIRDVTLGADGSLEDLIKVPAGGSSLPASEETVKNRGHFLNMAGREVFKHAVRKMGGAIEKSLKSVNLSTSEISWLIPHQANSRILDALTKQLDVPSEQVCKTVQKYGNTSAPSCAITLDELLQEQNIEVGENLVMVAFGSGLTWGASVLTQVEE